MEGGVREWESFILQTQAKTSLYKALCFLKKSEDKGKHRGLKQVADIAASVYRDTEAVGGFD